VKRYCHEVETGQRVPADQRLVTALAEIFARPSERPAYVASTPPLLRTAAYFRTEAVAAAPPSGQLKSRTRSIGLFAARN